ncbi:Transcriptional regulator OS=Streptomyces microflavus OX=1919 GN=Smic_09020 PE=3 SV=1 [Streptomyces microflavus]
MAGVLVRIRLAATDRTAVYHGLTYNGGGKGGLMRRLGELEAEIMDCLWRWNRPATVREVVDDINERRPVAYTTVMTVATILFNKGWLLRGKQGRAWLYTPVRSREAYSAALMEDALGASEDRPVALAHFVERMSEEEVAALRKALRTNGRQTKA